MTNCWISYKKGFVWITKILRRAGYLYLWSNSNTRFYYYLTIHFLYTNLHKSIGACAILLKLYLFLLKSIFLRNSSSKVTWTHPSKRSTFYLLWRIRAIYSSFFKSSSTHIYAACEVLMLAEVYWHNIMFFSCLYNFLKIYLCICCFLYIFFSALSSTSLTR